MHVRPESGYYTLPDLSHALRTPSATSATATLADRVVVPPGSGALVRTETGVITLVTDLGRGYFVPVPDALVQEFWQFFNELFSSPELKGLGELTLDMVRLVTGKHLRLTAHCKAHDLLPVFARNHIRPPLPVKPRWFQMG